MTTADPSRWPIYFYDKLVLGKPEAEVGVVTLWTPVSKLTQHLDPEKFALAGQLYSKEGINFLIRNILANPRIRRIVLWGEDRIGSGGALLKFFERGVDENHQIPETDFAQIHREIPSEALDAFRAAVEVVDIRGVWDLDAVKNAVAEHTPVGVAWREPETFPEAVVEFDGSLPSDQSIWKIRRKFAGETWLEIIKKIMRFGTVRESFHGNNCRELFNICSVITDEDPDDFKFFPWFQITPEDVANYLPKFMTGERGTADYTYGERLWAFPAENPAWKINQIDDVVVDFLSRYPTDRAAFAVTFGVQDHTAESAPCMTQIQATNVDGKLDLTAYFRSHDIFGGWLLNAYGLRTLQKYIADKLGWPVGNLTIISNCAHIYDNNWPLAQEMMEKYGKSLDCELDPRGFFVITTEGQEIVLKHNTPNGKFIQEFRQDGMSPRATISLYEQLTAADVVSLIPHAFDIGAEIMKAELAIKTGREYVQDRPLDFGEK